MHMQEEVCNVTCKYVPLCTFGTSLVPYIYYKHDAMYCVYLLLDYLWPQSSQLLIVGTLLVPAM